MFANEIVNFKDFMPPDIECKVDFILGGRSVNHHCEYNASFIFP